MPPCRDRHALLVRDTTYDLYGDFNVNYVKLDRLPGLEDWSAINNALRAVAYQHSHSPHYRLLVRAAFIAAVDRYLAVLRCALLRA